MGRRDEPTHKAASDLPGRDTGGEEWAEVSYHEYKRGEQRLCVYCGKSALSIYHFALRGRADSAPNYRASYTWRQGPPHP